MNQPADKPRTLLWGYVHNELPVPERRSVAQALSHDPNLRRSATATGVFDQRLRAAFAVLDADETVWADRALAAWDREQAAPPSVSWSRRCRWPLAAALAAAAALALLLTLPVPPSALQWDRPAFVPLVLRGAASAALTAHLAPDTATDCDRMLRAAVTDACRAHNLVPRPGLVLALRVQELPQSAFAVVVQARNRDGSQFQEWRGDYASVASFGKHLSASALAIAETIAVSPGP